MRSQRKPRGQRTSYEVLIKDPAVERPDFLFFLIHLVLRPGLLSWLMDCKSLFLQPEESPPVASARFEPDFGG